MPGQKIRENQRQRTGHQSRQTVSLDVDGVANTQFDVRQQFAAVGIQHDILAGTEESNGSGQIGHSPDRQLWPDETHGCNRD